MALLALCWQNENAPAISKTKKNLQSDNNATCARYNALGMQGVLLMTYILIYNYIYSYNTILIIDTKIYYLSPIYVWHYWHYCHYQ